MDVGSVWAAYFILILVVLLILYLGLNWTLGLSLLVALILGALLVLITQPLVRIQNTGDKEILGFLIGLSLILVLLVFIYLVARGTLFDVIDARFSRVR